MPGKLIAWHVDATLAKLAERLACTVDQLKRFGIAEDLRESFEALAPLEKPTHVSGVWETRQESETPVHPVEPIMLKLR